MAMIRCEECSDLLDGDHIVFLDHPTIDLAMICEDCWIEYGERYAREQELTALSMERDK